MKPTWLKNLPSHLKYHNVKVKIDGITFDSEKESRVYLDLKEQQRKKQIKGLRLQVPYVLVPAQYETRTVFDKKNCPKEVKRIAERAVTYVADFVVEHNDGTIVVVDCKGMKDALYKVKRKLMRHLYGIVIMEV